MRGGGVGVKIVVGLGNPGKAYAQTPHNAGFAVVDALAEAGACPWRGRWRFRAHTGLWTADGAEPVLLVKPDTFMNRSGEAVGAVLRWEKVAPDALLVVVDDADLPLGRLRLRPGGRSGGHRGLESIITVLGTDAFARLRLGIGRGAAVDGAPRDLVRHVLAPLSAADREHYAAAVARAAEAVRCWLREGTAVAMNRFNGEPSA